MKRLSIVGLFAAAAGLVACGEARESTLTPIHVDVTYVGAVKALLTGKCVACHGKTKQEGHYALQTWTGLLGPGSDTVPNAIAGDPKSRLLTVLDDKTHKALLDTTESKLLVDWVVKNNLAYFTSSALYHPRGWLNPGDRNALSFHGGFIRAQAWDLRECQLCHGRDFAGGKSKVSCRSCHKGGPRGCTTCHGDNATDTAAPPASLSGGFDPQKDRGVGAHAVHLKSTIFAPSSCAACHKVPTLWDSPGHVFDNPATQSSDLRAEITFGARAQSGGYAAYYNKRQGTCRVACHNLDKTRDMSWNAKASPKSCNACHASPHASPTKYGGADCTFCHQQGLARCKVGDPGCFATSKDAPTVGVRFTDPTTHGDGHITLGKAQSAGTCWACHGTKATGGAPAPDLDGHTDTSEVTVGLHAIHLKASTLFGAVACADCHKVPKSVTAPGHIDTDRPAEVTFSDLATGRVAGVDLKPTWDRKTATCKNVYCHSLDSAQTTTWTWTQKLVGGLTCNSCHGVPPTKTLDGSPHPPSTQCASCHSGAFLPSGQINPSTHANGKVNF